MKRFLTFTLLFLIVFSFSVNASSLKPPTVSADGAIVLDANSGTILYSKNIDAAYPPASTTKIMTALLTLEHCKLNDVVVVGKNPPNADGSKIYILEGEKLTVDQLLHGLLLSSANDCAETLAEHIGGSINKFADMMNNRAKQLGCKNTHFVNPSGLYNKNHKTSAKDLALIMRELVKHPEFMQIAKTVSYTIPPTNKSKEARPLWNENRLIRSTSKFYCKNCEGGKTGYTVQSLHSYVCSGSKDNHRLIVALVHDKNKTFFKDANALLNYGFDNFKVLNPYIKGQTIGNYILDKKKIPLIIDKSFFYTVEKDKIKNSKFKIEPNILSSIKHKSIKKGESIGTATIFLNNKNVGTINLISGCNYKHETIFSSISKKNFKIQYALYILIATIIVFVISFLIIKKNKTKLHRHSKNRYVEH